MKPSVNRSVHYQSFGTPGGEYSSQPRAAIVTEVDPDGETVGLAILNPTGMFFTQHVKHAPGDKPTPGCWNWPPGWRAEVAEQSPATPEPVLADLPGAAEWADSPHSQMLVARARSAVARLMARRDHKCSCGGECSRANEAELAIIREQVRMLGYIIGEIEGAAGRAVDWDGALPPPRWQPKPTPTPEPGEPRTP